MRKAVVAVANSDHLKPANTLPANIAVFGVVRDRVGRLVTHDQIFKGVR